MVEPLRHRRTKGAETDMLDLTPPRHTPTLLSPAVRFASTVALALRLKGRGRVRSRARCQRYLPDLKCRLQTVRAASLATYSIASSLDILASDRRRFRIHSCVSAPKRDPLLEWSANH